MGTGAVKPAPQKENCTSMDDGLDTLSEYVFVLRCHQRDKTVADTDSLRVNAHETACDL